MVLRRNHTAVVSVVYSQEMRSDEREHLCSLDQWEALPWCPTCGLSPGLTSGFLALDEFPTVLFCKGCDTPLVAL